MNERGHGMKAQKLIEAARVRVEKPASSFRWLFCSHAPRCKRSRRRPLRAPDATMATQMSKKRKVCHRFFLPPGFPFHSSVPFLTGVSFTGEQFVADGVFFAELNELLTRELAEDGYSGVEVRVTPMRTEIIIRATRTQNVLGKLGF